MQHTSAFSSQSVEWETPQSFYDAWDQVYRFTLDTAASPENAKAPKFYTKEDDGLSQVWSGNVWCNPPYGRQIGKWVEKAYRSTRTGAALVVMLIPAKTETRWWHDYVIKADSIYFVKGRIQFGDSGVNAPFPSCVVVFRNPLEADERGPQVFWGGTP